MLYFLFTIEQEVKGNIPNVDSSLLKYEPVLYKSYYVLKIDGDLIQILNENDQEVSNGVLIPNVKEDLLSNNKVLFRLNSGVLTHSGGILSIVKNDCTLIIYASGKIYSGAYKGTLVKLKKKI